MMLLAFLPLLLPVVQETPLVQGAYRGPYDQVLIELAHEAERQTAAAAQRLSGGLNAEESAAQIVDAYERWEFWFEHERLLLFRGPGEPLPAVLGEDMRYGHGEGSFSREEFQKAAFPVLVDALQSGHPQLREAAAIALGRTGAVEVRDLLIESLEDRAPQVRQAAILGLGLMHDSRNVGQLAEIFVDGDKDFGERQFAALALGLSGRNEAITFLHQYLKDNLTTARVLMGEQELLIAAVWAAGLYSDSNLITLFISACENLGSTAARDSQRLRLFLIHALGNMGDQICAPFLIGQLNSRDVEMQRAAAQALGRIRSPKGAIAALLTAAVDLTDIEARLFSILAIGRLGGDEAVAALKKLLPVVRRQRQLHAAWGLAVGFAQSDELHSLLASELVSRQTLEDPQKMEGSIRRDEERLRGAFALGLGFFGEDEDEKLILKTIQQKGLSPEFVGYLANALGLLDGEVGAKYLFEMAQQERPAVEASRGVAWGIGFSTHSRASEQLVGLLSRSKHAEVRWAAAQAMSELRTKAALNALVALLEKVGDQDVDPGYFAHYVMALGNLGDARNGDGLGSLLAGLNYRIEFPLLRALRGF